MKWKDTIQKTIRSLTFVLALGLVWGVSEVQGQFNVFSKSDANENTWFSDQNPLPWFYSGADDRTSPDRALDQTFQEGNNVHYGHNEKLTQVVNGRYYSVRQLIFQAGASSSRTFNSTGGGGIDMGRNSAAGTSKIENESSAIHTLNVPVALHRNPVEFNPLNGNLSFQQSIFNNGNSIEVYGDNGQTLFIGGEISGSGGFRVKQNSIVWFETNNKTYTGDTFVENGTLRGFVNIASTNIQVQDAATFRASGNLSVENLEIQNGGTLTVDSGQTLTVNGNLTLGATSITNIEGNLIVNGTLNIAAGKTLVIPSGRSLIASNITYNGTGAIEFQRILESPSFSTEPEVLGHWVALSSPAAGEYGANGLLSNVWTQGFAGANDTRTNVGSNVLLFDETEPPVIVEDDAIFDNSYKRPESANMIKGRGFFAFLFEQTNMQGPGEPVDVNFDTPFSITGEAFSVETFTFPATFTPGGANGFNLLGNPWGAILDWSNQSQWVRPDMNNFLYVWNPSLGSAGDFATLENTASTSLIAPFQAFFVKLNEDEDFSVNPNARTTSDTDVHLNSSDEPVAFQIEIQMSGQSSEAIYRFSDKYEAGLDNTDAYYLAPMAYTFASVFSIVDGQPIKINSLPLETTEQLSFPLVTGGFINGQPYSGSASLSFTGINNLPSNIRIFLKDNLLGTEKEVTEGYVYNYELIMAQRSNLTDLSLIRKGSTPLANRQSFENRFEITINPTTTSTPIDGELPQVMALNQNYPNPFNPTTQISYDLPQSADVRLDVFNIQGQRVATLVNAAQSAGTHNVTFDAANLASGVYLYRLQAGATVLTKKMTLVK
jgi:archaellum component FlaF (FlaF/FlaG flagellin family)